MMVLAERLQLYRDHLLACLDGKDFYYETRLPRVLYVLSKVTSSSKAQSYAQQARELRSRLVPEDCPGIDNTTEDDLVVYDQMVNVWSGRFTGKLNHEWRDMNIL